MLNRRQLKLRNFGLYQISSGDPDPENQTEAVLVVLAVDKYWSTLVVEIQKTASFLAQMFIAIEVVAVINHGLPESPPVKSPMMFLQLPNLVMTDIAMGFRWSIEIDGLPMKNGDFPWQTVSHNQSMF